MPLVMCRGCFQLYNAAAMASTNPVPPRLRGKVAGLTSASLGLGGALGPFIFSIMFAWSISTTSSDNDIPLVDQHFAFNIGAAVRIVLLALLWKVLGEDTLTEVVGDAPSLVKLSSMELENIDEEEISESLGTLNVEGRRANLV